METWIQDAVGLALAFDTVTVVGIIAYATIKYWNYDWVSYVESNQHIYKNYNYTITDKDKINADV